MNITQMAPLYLSPVDTQIKTHGGRGYNCDVETTDIKGSFQTIYTFDTDDGKKSLITPNYYHVATHMDGDGDQWVITYNGDVRLFEMTYVKFSTGGRLRRLARTKTLGGPKTLAELVEALGAIDEEVAPKLVQIQLRHMIARDLKEPESMRYS